MSKKNFGYAQMEGVKQGMASEKDWVFSGSSPVASFTGLPTIDLRAELGPNRLIEYDTIDEIWHCAAAIGSALVGVKAINWHGMFMANSYLMQLVTQHAAKVHHMTGGQGTCPAVFVVSMAGKLMGFAGQHSDYEEDTWFAHTPGLKTVVPSTVYDAKGLMISAIKTQTPVVYLNARTLGGLVDDVPDEPFEVPIGKAAVRVEGTDITIAGHGPVMPDVLAAAESLEDNDGVSVEVIDIRTLRPMDTETLVASARKTGRFMTAEHSKYSLGPGAEAVARVAEEVPGVHVTRISHPDTPPPGAPEMLNYTYPDIDNILAGARGLLSR
ncbi:MAG: transketolase C-terminal domain-containing protein [Dehalococcoidia bacterium]|jgi:pyruvate dehydrogenase E1 component beta subunit|nr:transketolase C-terminal domain-containing protein [Dehalococcoidia bacterium]|tara:strand:+ start:375 stop:1352 length:978 start_codon:yes stop_codon:yes gene_type:complete